MKRATIIAITILFAMSIAGTVFADSHVDMKMLKWTANTDMATFGHNKAIVKAVRAQNKEDMSLDQIQLTDGAWRGVKEGTLGIMDELMSNDCAEAAQEILESRSYIMEIFVTDNKGANVCMTDKTGDYWQGDEAKFVNAYNGGMGAVFVDEEIEMDDSTRANIGQVSVPVVRKGMAIGVMTIGVYTDYL